MEQVRVVFVKNPFDPLLTREIHDFPVGKTVYEYAVDVCGDGIEGYDIIASVNGCEFLPETCNDFRPVGNDVLVFACSPQGGKGGKSIIALVAMIAIMIIAPYAGAAMGELAIETAGVNVMAAETLGGMIAAYGGYAIGYGAVMVAGGLLLSALAPKPPQLGADSSATYSWDEKNNFVHEGATLPELYGQMRVTPPLVSHYILTDGNRQYLNLLYAIAGHKITSIDNIYINDNLSSTYTGVETVTDRIGNVNQPVIDYFGDNRVDISVHKSLLGYVFHSATKGATTTITLYQHDGLTFSGGVALKDPHTITVGESVYIQGLNATNNPTWYAGMNGNSYTVTATTDDTITISHDSSGYSDWVNESTRAVVSPWKTATSDGTSLQGFNLLFTAPKGVFLADRNDGGIDKSTVRIIIQYRMTGDLDWITLKSQALTTYNQAVAEWQWGYWTYIYADEGGGGTWTWVKVDDPATWPGIWTIDEGSQQGYYSRPTLTYEYISGNIFIKSGDPVEYQEISGDSITPLLRSFAKDHLPKEGQVDFRAAYYTCPSMDYRDGADIYFERYQEIMYDDFCFPGTALVAIKALATDQLSGSAPRVEVVATRDKVWIRDASNARAEQDANNPAWLSLYLIQRDGEGVPYDRCDYTAFSAWATYCDTRGYFVNIYFDQAENLRKQLNKVSLLGRAVVVQVGSKFTCIVDKAETVTQAFSFGMGNIIKDTFKEEYIPMDDRADSVEVTFWDKDNNWDRTSIELYCNGYDDLDREPVKASVTLYGCTGADEAKKYGYFMLNNNRYITHVASWEAGVDSIACLPGDVVSVSHDVPQIGNSGRVVSATASSITLDQEVTIGAGTYYVMVRQQGTDTIETKTVTDGAGTYTTLNISGTWTTTPEKFANYAVGLSTTYIKYFRVTRISKASDLTRRISAIEYNSDIYTETGSGATPVSYTSPFATSWVSATEVYIGGDTTNIAVKWDGVSLMWNLWVQVYNNTTTQFGPFIKVASTPGNEWLLTTLKSGVTYRIWVSHTSNPANGSSADVTLAGKVYTPYDVAFDDARCLFTDLVYLYWSDPFDPGVAGYEIRTDTNWGNDTNLIYRGAATSYAWNSFGVSPTTSSYTFYLKSYDIKDQYCDTADSIALSVATPSAPSTVTVDATLGKVSLAWAEYINPIVVGIEVWRHTSNDRAGASKIGETNGNVYVDANNVISGNTYYYWLRARTKYATYSTWSTGDTSGHNDGVTPALVSSDVSSGNIFSWHLGFTSIGSISATEGDKLTSVGSGATWGATWGTNIFNPPTQIGSINATEGNKFSTIQTSATYGANSAEAFKLGTVAVSATWGATWGTTIVNPPTQIGSINATEGDKLATVAVSATWGAIWGFNVSSQPTTIGSISATEGDKLASVGSGATAGATWGTNIFNLPTKVGSINAAEGDKLGTVATSATYGANSAEAFKLGTIATSATWGATWGVSIGSQPTAVGSINATEGVKLASVSSGADSTGRFFSVSSNVIATDHVINENVTGAKLSPMVAGNLWRQFMNSSSYSNVLTPNATTLKEVTIYRPGQYRITVMHRAGDTFWTRPEYGIFRNDTLVQVGSSIYNSWETTTFDISSWSTDDSLKVKAWATNSQNQSYIGSCAVTFNDPTMLVVVQE